LALITIPGLGGRKLHAVSEDGTVSPDGDTVEITLAPVETRIFTTSLGGAARLPSLADIRAEQARLEAEFRKQNPSVCTYREGAVLDASWGFPEAPEVKWASWYRMIDGWPGTPWRVGQAFRPHEIKGWREKDFSSAGRWIEVRLPKPQEINTIRAIVSPWADVAVRVLAEDGWREVKGERVVDGQKRHHSHPSATTTARFDAIRTDRFRVVFTNPRAKQEVVFELSAAKL